MLHTLVGVVMTLALAGCATVSGERAWNMMRTTAVPPHLHRDPRRSGYQEFTYSSDGRIRKTYRVKSTELRDFGQSNQAVVQEAQWRMAGLETGMNDAELLTAPVAAWNMYQLPPAPAVNNVQPSELQKQHYLTGYCIGFAMRHNQRWPQQPLDLATAPYGQPMDKPFLPEWVRVWD